MSAFDPPLPTGDPPVDLSAVDQPTQRFSAALTTAVLALVLLSGSGQLLVAQAVVFALGAFAGPRFAPYSVAFRTVVAPRLHQPSTREDAAPMRFPQAVGLVLAAVGAVGYLAGAPALGIVATALALAAAFLTAAFGICLGCKLPARIAPIRKNNRKNHHQQGATA